MIRIIASLIWSTCIGFTALTLLDAETIKIIFSIILGLIIVWGLKR